MLMAFMLFFYAIGALFIVFPRQLGMQDFAMMTDMMGIFVMMMPYAFLVMRSIQSSAIYLIEPPKQGEVIAQVTYKDGSTRFYPAIRKPAAFLKTKFGLFRDRLQTPFAFPLGHRVYPCKTDMLATANPKESEYSARIMEKFNINTPAEMYLLAKKVQFFIDQTKQGKDEEVKVSDDQILNLRKTIGENDADKLILKMNKRALKKYIAENPVPPHIMEEEITGETVDYFSIQEFSLDDGMPKDFETLVKAERIDEYLGKKEMSTLGLSPNVLKIIFIIALVAVGIFVIFIVLKGNALQGLFGR